MTFADIAPYQTILMSMKTMPDMRRIIETAEAFLR